jgi:hypothetical protein
MYGGSGGVDGRWTRGEGMCGKECADVKVRLCNSDV